MKIIHITASYKPAYVYGGPIQSVGKLCEALEEVRAKGSFDYAQDDNENSLELDIRYSAEKIDKKSLDHAQDGTCRNCIDENLQIEVLTTTANGKEELALEAGKTLAIDGVSVTYFKRWTKDHSHFSPGLLWTLRRKILRYTQDDKLNTANQNLKKPPRLTDTLPKEGNILHIHAWWNLVSVLSCLVAKWYKIPVVLSPRGMLTSYTFGNRNSFSKRIVHKLMGETLLKYCHIHATSEQEKRDILKIVTPKSIRVIANLVSLGTEVAGSGYQVASSKYQDSLIFNIIFLSRIEEKKGLELLFEALALVHIPWQLSIGGTGKEEYIQSLRDKAETLKLSERITWLGQVSNEDKFNLMAMHDLTVLTSYNENFANVVVESLSVGTPVLISKFVGLADYVLNKNLGWITSLEIFEIKDQILNAFLSIAKRLEIRNKSSSIIKEDFSDKALIKKYLNMYVNIQNEQ